LVTALSSTSKEGRKEQILAIGHITLQICLNILSSVIKVLIPVISQKCQLVEAYECTAVVYIYINYKRLNDNTVDDAYNILNKQEWINKIQDSKYFSKFDLKVGFWQVKMEEESIPWTAFTCPQGHYEWLVMSLGLKNTLALFQRKMQKIFNENQEFVLVYIDDLLIFLKTYKEHISHLDMFFRKVEQNGLILSKKINGNMQRKTKFLRS
jgi:hypothetical protein